MNPFSAFLQPAPQRPIDMSGVGDVVRTLQAQKEFKQRQLENTQQNTLAQANSRRGDAELALQQGEQSHRFGVQDQKQQEDLMAEYHDAVDTGDPVRIGRAIELLKRSGIDYRAGGTKPDLKAFTGESLLPSVQQAPSEKPFQNPIDQAVETEQASRDALRAKNANPSQEDLENQLVNDAESNPAPENMEKGGKTTPEYKAYLDKTHPSAPDAPVEPVGKTVDMGDVDSPEFKAQAQRESTSQAPQAAAALPPRLPTQLLPTVISKGGKVLESSQEQAGRYSPMVASVFEPFTRHENPEMADAARQAQAMTAQLVKTDGVPPAKAIQFGLNWFKEEANRINSLERTKIGSRAHVAGMGLASGTLTGKDLAALGDDADKIMMGLTAKPEYQKVQVMDDVLNGAESALQSNDPLRQQQAISDIMRARSGLTVRKDEEDSLRNSAGIWEGIKAKLSQGTGYGLTPSYRSALAQAIAQQRAINQRIKGRMAREAAEYYKTTRTTEGEQGARKGQVDRNAGAIKQMLERGGGNGDSAPEGEYGGL